MSNSSFLPSALMERMAEFAAEGPMQIPPPIFLDMDGEIVDINLEEKTLTAYFPVKERYQNPMGYMQGGMIATAADNTIGPLSFIVAPPSVTKTMTVSYRRPITSHIEKIKVVARFVEQNGRELTFSAQVLRDENTVLAEVTALQIIISKTER